MKQLIDRYLTNTKAFQFFHLLRQGANILIAILLVKTYLSVQQIGIYEQLIFIGYTLSFFWIVGFVQVLLSNFPGSNVPAQKQFYFNAYLLFLCLSGCLFFTLLFGKTYILTILVQSKDLPYFELFSLFLLINIPTYLLENFLLLAKKPAQIVYFGLFSFGFHILALIAPLWWGFPFIWSFWALIALASLKHAWLLVFLIGNSQMAWNFALIKQWSILALPLILYSLMGTIIQSMDSWLVNYLHDGNKETFAIFRYGAREFPLVLAMATAFSSSMLPVVTEDLNRALVDIKRKSLKLIHFLFPISILLVTSSFYWFPMVFSQAFNESVQIFNLFLLIIISRLIFSHTLMIGLKENKIILLISVLEFFINLGISLLLWPYLGLVGIAIGTVLALTFEKVVQTIYLFAKYKIPLNKYVELRWYMFYSVLLLFAFIFSLRYK